MSKSFIAFLCHRFAIIHEIEMRKKGPEMMKRVALAQTFETKV